MIKSYLLGVCCIYWIASPIIIERRLSLLTSFVICRKVSFSLANLTTSESISTSVTLSTKLYFRQKAAAIRSPPPNISIFLGLYFSIGNEHCR